MAAAEPLSILCSDDLNKLAHLLLVRREQSVLSFFFFFWLVSIGVLATIWIWTTVKLSIEWKSKFCVSKFRRASHFALFLLLV